MSNLFLLLLSCSACAVLAGLDNVTAVVKNDSEDKAKILINVDIQQVQGYKHVTLTNCSIPNLKAGNLSYLKDVEVFGLVEVKLEALGIGSFGGLYYIERLYIIGNKIKTISGGVFNDHGFVSLDLRANHIGIIENASFRYMDNLRSLDLSNNDISYIHPETFMGTDNLEVINLSRNSFRGKFPEFISSLWNVQVVDLSHNRIEVIEWDSVLGLSGLRRLVLSDNIISTIAGGSFTDLDSLTFLELFYNRLECISYNTLYSLRVYSSIYLGKNRITDDCRKRLRQFKRNHPDINIYY